MLNYPSNLPSPLLKSFSLKQQSNLLRTSMNSGRVRVRRRFLSVPTFVNATWKLNQAQAAQFEGFIEYALHSAASWFLMDILTPTGLIQHEVRFVTSPLEDYHPISATWWEYRAQIEMKKRQMIDEEQTANAVLKPKTIEQFIDGVNNAIESYQEE